MGMSTSIHCNTFTDDFKVEGYVTTNALNDLYVVLSISVGSGYNHSEVTNFLNLEQVQAIKKELIKIERQFKKELEKVGVK